MESGNPTLNSRVWGSNVARSSSNVMTLQGAVNKCFIMLGLVVATAIVSWNTLAERPELMGVLAFGGGLAGFVVAMIACFKPRSTPVTGPIYAVLEGLFIGAVSLLFESRYPGIVQHAVLMTFGVFAMMLFLYKIRALQATPGFVKGVIAATGAIFVVYALSWILMLFGIQMPFLYSGGLAGIGISVVIVVIAALNLIIDFAVIEQGAATGQEKYMEWYAAFGLTVTLVWLYLEILRLLGKMRR